MSDECRKHVLELILSLNLIILRQSLLRQLIAAASKYLSLLSVYELHLISFFNLQSVPHSKHIPSSFQRPVS